MTTDIDLWPITTKIESVNSWEQLNVWTKYKEIPSRCWDALTRRTDGQLDNIMPLATGCHRERGMKKTAITAAIKYKSCKEATAVTKNNVFKYFLSNFCVILRYLSSFMYVSHVDFYMINSSFNQVYNTNNTNKHSYSPRYDQHFANVIKVIKLKTKTDMKVITESVYWLMSLLLLLGWLENIT